MIKRHPKKTDDDWLLTYSDMMTLILCFFVMIVAISSPDLAKFENIRSGMNATFGDKSIKRPIAMLLSELSEDIKASEIKEGIYLSTDSQGVIIEFNEDIIFEDNTASIKESIIPTLKRISATLLSERYENFDFNVEGHTSDVQTSSISNWEFSAKRAASVAEFMQERNTKKERLKVTGMADVSPKYPNFDAQGNQIPENRKQNQRLLIHANPVF